MGISSQATAPDTMPTFGKYCRSSRSSAQDSYGSVIAVRRYLLRTYFNTLLLKIRAQELLGNGFGEASCSRGQLERAGYAEIGQSLAGHAGVT